MKPGSPKRASLDQVEGARANGSLLQILVVVVPLVELLFLVAAGHIGALAEVPRLIPIRIVRYRDDETPPGPEPARKFLDDRPFIEDVLEYADCWIFVKMIHHSNEDRPHRRHHKSETAPSNEFARCTDALCHGHLFLGEIGFGRRGYVAPVLSPGSVAGCSSGFRIEQTVSAIEGKPADHLRVLATQRAYGRPSSERTDESLI